MDAKIYKNKKMIPFFLIPAFAFMLLYLFYPFFLSVLNSLGDIKGLGSNSEGWQEPLFENYIRMFKDENMHIAIKNTIIMIFATIFGQVGIALLLALLVSNIKKGAGFFRVVYFFPIVISATALGLLFNIIFLYNKGMLNEFLQNIGYLEFEMKNGIPIKDELIDWKDEAHALVTMLIPVIWQYVGFYFVILLTGLSGISEELYEAASIDGATKIQCVTSITLPLLKSSISTCVILAVTGALKVFDLPWTMLPHGTSDTWLTGTYMYEQVMQRKDVDYSAAISIFIVVLGVALSFVVKNIFKDNQELDA